MFASAWMRSSWKLDKKKAYKLFFLGKRGVSSVGFSGMKISKIASLVPKVSSSTGSLFVYMYYFVLRV